MVLSPNISFGLFSGGGQLLVFYSDYVRGTEAKNIKYPQLMFNYFLLKHESFLKRTVIDIGQFAAYRTDP